MQRIIFSQGAQFAKPGTRHPFAHREVEAVEGWRSAGVSDRRKRLGVIPAGEQGVDHSGEELYRSMLFQRVCEVETRWNSKALESRPQSRKINIGIANDNAGLAELGAGQNAAGNLF